MLIKQDLDEAQQYLDTALPLAQRTGHVAMILHVLAAAAYLYEAQGNYARAIETAAFVEHHYSTWEEDKKRAAVLLERNRQTLSVEQFDRLVASSRQLQLEDFQIEPEK